MSNGRKQIEAKQAPNLNIAEIPPDFSGISTRLEQLGLETHRSKPSAIKLSQRKSLIRALSSNEQRKDYRNFMGKTWHENFVFARKEARPTNRTRGARISKLWLHFLDSKFKRCIQTFSHGNYLALPKSLIEGPIDKSIKKRVLGQATLKGCIFSPDRIPNKLLQDLGIVVWKECGITNKVDALIKKSSLNVINGLKYLFEAAAQLVPDNQRILLIGHATQQIQRRYQGSMGTYKIPDGIVGSILYFREKKPVGRDIINFTPKHFHFRPLTVQFFDTVYEATRRVAHVDVKHKAELSIITRFSTQLTQLQNRLDLEWKEHTAVEHKKDLQATVDSTITEVIEWLKSSVDKDKRKALDKLQNIALRLEERKSGLINPRATLVQVASCVSALQQRFTEVSEQTPHTVVDYVAFQKEKDRAETEFAIIYQNLLKSEKVTSIHLPSIDRPKQLQPGDIERDLQTIKNRLGVSIKSLEALKLRPFITFTKQTIAAYNLLEQAVTVGSRRAVNNLIIAMFYIADFQRINASKERCLTLLATNKNIGFSELLASIEELSACSKPRTIFSGYKLQDIDTLHTVLIDNINEFYSSLKLHTGKDLDSNMREELVANTKSFLKTLNIEQIVATLTLPAPKPFRPNKPR